MSISFAAPITADECRRALPEGAERTALRHALDDLTFRHLPPADAERLAGVQLDSEIKAERAPEVTASSSRVWPQPQNGVIVAGRPR
ncbi:hypothetical protein [Nonomuraea sp. NPDC052265]|uniref:hypothetical protein n=1 Tax=Nonomuraea sp. NPDC052265 TaxID=3364374 RepID=UPI0037C71C67